MGCERSQVSHVKDTTSASITYRRTQKKPKTMQQGTCSHRDVFYSHLFLNDEIVRHKI